MNENEIKLSYIITTRNKLLSLREVLSRLVKERRQDEEIIVVDGASKDGTVDYLRSLYDSGQIQQFISEPDQGEAHGYNKGLLMAQGELIKVITDDDAFYWPGIRSCKEFMLAHPEVDILGTDGANISLSCLETFIPENYIFSKHYKKWQKTSKAFNFSGLGMMIRRKSLSLLGLFNAAFVWVDYEYSVRITAEGFGNLAWYTGPIWVRILNPSSNVITQNQRINLDRRKLNQFYIGDGHYKNEMKKYSRLAKNYMVKFKRFPKRMVKIMARQLGLFSEQPSILTNNEFSAKDWEACYEMCDQWLKEQDKKKEWQFITASPH